MGKILLKQLQAAGAAGNTIRSNGSNVISIDLSSYQATPSNPMGTTSATGAMMGLDGSITPVNSGQILIVLSGEVNNSGAGNGANFQIRYGTGTAPGNGIALTGTAVGRLGNMTNDQISGLLATLTPGKKPFSLNSYITGLIVGTAYWIDISLAAIGGGTATVTDVSISIIEV